MVAITVAATFGVPSAIVWEELRHIDRHVAWMTDAVAIDFVSAQREGVGTSFVCTTKVGPFTTRDRMIVTGWVEGASMGVEHRGIVAGRGVFTLERVEAGTKMTWSEQLDFPWFALGPLGAWCAKPVLGALWKRNLKSLGARLPQAAN